MLALLTLVFLAAPGPVDRPCPVGVAVVRGAEALRALLAGDATDIWIAGKVVGDFEAQRAGTAKGTQPSETRGIGAGLALHGCEQAVLEGSGKGTVLKLHGDDLLVEDLTFQNSGIRTSFEDGALKVSGERAMVRRVSVRETLYGIAYEQCHACQLEDAEITGRTGLEENQRGDAVKLWEAHGSSVHRIWVHGMRDVVVWYSRHVTLEDIVESQRAGPGRFGAHIG